MTVPGAVSPHAQVTIDSPGREVTITGPLGARTVPELRGQLQQVLGEGEGDLVLHLGQAEIIDATGLGLLAGVHQRARRLGRRLVLAEASERLERLLAVTRLHRVLARVDPTTQESTDPLRLGPRRPRWPTATEASQRTTAPPH